MKCLEGYPMSRQNRTRDQSIAFHVTKDEMIEINARIKMSGLSRGDYFIKTFLEQEIHTVIGKFECDRLAVELKRLRECIEKVKNDEIETLLKECKALLNEMIVYLPVRERKSKNMYSNKIDFNDIFTDVEVL